MRCAGQASEPGDVLRAEVVGPGQLLLVRSEDPLRLFVGSLTSVYLAEELDKLRDEWG